MRSLATHEAPDVSNPYSSEGISQEAKQIRREASPIDRLHWHLGLAFGDDDSQIAVTLGTGALEILGHSVLSLGQAFVHHESGNFQPKPFRQFFHADGEPPELKSLDLQD